MSKDTAPTSWAMSGTVNERTEATLDPSTIRELIDKSVTLLETKCIRLNGHDPNWRALFPEHRDDIEQREFSCRPRERDSTPSSREAV